MNKRKLSFILAALLTINTVAVAAFPAYADVDERLAAIEAQATDSEISDIPEAVQAAIDAVAPCSASDSEIEGAQDEAVATAAESEYAITMSAEADDGVIVMLEADEGVFPEGATLYAQVATPGDAEEAQEDVEKLEKGENVAKRTTYDIRVMLGEEEVQPDNSKGRVKVSFIIPDAPTGADAANIYHHTEDGVETVLDNASLSQTDETAEETLIKAANAEDTINAADTAEDEEAYYASLDGDIENDVNDECADDDYDDTDDFDAWSESNDEHDHEHDDETCDCCDCSDEDETEVTRIGRDPEAPVVLTAEIESFSLYTVDFTYEDKKISIPGDTAAVLAGVLAGVGITGDIADAVMSDDAEGLVSVYQDGTWMIKGMKAFDTTHKLTVTMSDGAVYEVVVTDAATITGCIRGYAQKETSKLRVSELLEIHTEGFASNATLKYVYTLTGTSKDDVLAISRSDSPNLTLHSDSKPDLNEPKLGGKGKIVNDTLTPVEGSDIDITKCKYFAVLDNYSSTGRVTYGHLTVSVTVTDTNSKSSTYNQSVTVSYGQSTGNTFLAADLKTDVANIDFIIYEGESKTLKSWFGLSGLAHITCSCCAITKKSNPDSKIAEYSGADTGGSLKGVSRGETKMTVDLTKKASGYSCGHHYGQSVTGEEIGIWVIAKPTFTQSVSDKGVDVGRTTAGVTYTIGNESHTATKDDEVLTFTTVPLGTSQTCVLTANWRYQYFEREEPFTTDKGVVDPSKITITDKVYNGQNQVADTSLPGGCKVKTNAGGTAVGTYPVVVELEEGYEWKGGSTADLTLDFHITQRPVTISGITAQDKYFDGSTRVTLVYDHMVLDGKIDKDKLSATVTGAFENAAVGTNKKVYLDNHTLTGDDKGNYKLATTGQQAETTASISQRDNEIPEIIFPDEYPYGETPASPSCQPKYGSPSAVKYWYEGTKRDGTPYGPTEEMPTDAGNYTIHASLSETPEYKSAHQQKDFTIHALEVKEPEIASKSYTGKKQIATVPISDKYKVTDNPGGISVKPDYPVVLELRNPNNYYWSKLGEHQYQPETTVPFEITPAKDNEITEIIFPDEYPYGETPASPSCQPKYGSPSDVKYWYDGTLRDGTKYGPTDKQPTEAGNYTIHASLSETPEYPAAYQKKDFIIHALEVKEPEIASKSYTGEKQIADVPPSDKYNTKTNNGGINAKPDYPVDLELATPNNYYWSKLGEYPYEPETTVPFEITKASDNEIPEIIFPDEFPYGTPSSTPSCQPKYGSPSDVKYWYEGTLRDGTKYGPTDKQPTEAGNYTIHASLSETPDYPAAHQQKDFIIHALEVKEPEIASKSYTGEKQTADVPPSDKYNTKTNDGGIKAKPDYPVELRLATPNNYYWSKLGEYPYAPETTVPFEILKADNNEIKNLNIDNWTYSSPSSTPSCEPKYGTPSYEFYKKGPEPGEWSDPLPSTPSDAGDYKIVAEIATTSDYNGCTAEKPFTIYPMEIPVPATQSVTYDGKFHSSHFEEISDLYTADDVTKRDTGVYDVPLKIGTATPSNYKWADGTEGRDNTAYFEIIKAKDNEIPEIFFPDEFPYGTPSSTPSCQPKYGSPSDVKYWYDGLLRDGTPYGPTEEQPTEAGHYTIHASLSETPEYPAAYQKKDFIIHALEVKEPEMASKSYTGQRQIADADDTDRYRVTKNDGGINAKPDYPVDLILKNPNNYYWSKLGEYPYEPETTVPFEIMKASDNEIPEIIFPDEFPYGTPSSTPSCQPKYGSPSDVKYWYEGTLRDGTKYGPTEEQPTEAGNYTIHASLSETPDYPAAHQQKDFIIHALEVKEPEIASKSYTGEKQTADVPPSDKYNTKTNNGGINAKPDYPVELRLATPNNYYWSKLGEYPYAPETTVPFEIMPAKDNEIKNLNIDNWTYSSPSSTPSCEPKYGTPSYEFYKKGPGPDEWTGPLPGTPSNVGEYKVVATVATTSDYNGCQAEKEFKILAAEVEVPVIADKVYSGMKQRAYIDQRKYTVEGESIIIASSNEGWYGDKLATCSYDFYLELDPNYVWETTKTTRVDLVFRIIPDPMDDKKKTPEEKAKGETYESGEAKIKVWTYKEEGAPTTYIENLNLALAYNLLTDDEKTKYDNGDDMAAEIRLEVRPKDEASLSQTERDEIQKQISAITNGRLGVYLDLTLWKDVTIGTSPMYTTALHDTAPNTIKIRVSVPEDLRKQNRTYYVARVHEDVGTVLPTEQVADTWIDLDFETTKFSTYAILYSDPSSPAAPGGGPVEYKWWKPTDSGWVKQPETENWYVIQNDNLVKGWFHDNEDNFWYFLDTSSGIMKEGWQQVGGKWYYFTPIDQVPQGTWFFNQNGDGKWHYYGDKSFHTHGSMYCNEQTPDGYWVDETGARIDVNNNWWTEDEADAGWVKKTGTTDWYYIKNNTLKKGWHDDPEDGHRYYLDPITGIMFKDWNRIGNYLYYFTKDEDVPEQTWFNDKTTDGWWHYYGDGSVLHPLGSMYRNETTPDGRTVNASGVRID